MQGEFSVSEQVTIGYFEQDLVWADGTMTPLQIISNAYPDLPIKEVRKHLAQCGVSSKHAMQQIDTLSGGAGKSEDVFAYHVPLQFFDFGRADKSP